MYTDRSDQLLLKFPSAYIVIYGGIERTEHVGNARTYSHGQK